MGLIYGFRCSGIHLLASADVLASDRDTNSVSRGHNARSEIEMLFESLEG